MGSMFVDIMFGVNVFGDKVFGCKVFGCKVVQNRLGKCLLLLIPHNFKEQHGNFDKEKRLVFRVPTVHG